LNQEIGALLQSSSRYCSAYFRDSRVWAHSTLSAADPDVLCPPGMHNHASSRAIGVGTAVLIIDPELRTRARWDVG